MAKKKMQGRDIHEEHRASTNLELFFDLIIVVAVAQASGGLHHMLSHGEYVDGVIRYLMAFWCVFLSWLNFSWFASAYDTDDTLYRVTTALQMLGAITLAVGINDMFKPEPSVLVAFFGFVIMRVALVSQWLRAAKQHPERRKTCLTYAIGISIAQVGWIFTVMFSGIVQLIIWIFMASVELSIYYLSERHGQTPWHPHHIAERYGLLVIIVLGECITGIIGIVGETTHHNLWEWLESAMPVILSSLAIVFAMWWTYFKLPLGNLLEKHRDAAYPFGFIHYFVFASLASLGAGLGLLADYMGDMDNAQLAQTAILTIATASGVYLLLISIINVILFKQRRASIKLLAIAIIAPAIPMALYQLGIPLQWAIFSAVCPPVFYTYSMKIRSQCE